MAGLESVSRVRGEMKLKRHVKGLECQKVRNVALS